MNNIKWPFLFLAIAAVLSMAGVGISIGFRSYLGAALSVLALIGIMGFGFSLKKRLYK